MSKKMQNNEPNYPMIFIVVLFIVISLIAIVVVGVVIANSLAFTPTGLIL